MNGKDLLKTINPHIKVFRDRDTGLAYVNNGLTGGRYTCHPNIDESGSVEGMIFQGWDKDDVIVEVSGFLYNISKYVVIDPFEKEAAKFCNCGGYHGDQAETSANSSGGV